SGQRGFLLWSKRKLTLRLCVAPFLRTFPGPPYRTCLHCPVLPPVLVCNREATPPTDPARCHYRRHRGQFGLSHHILSASDGLVQGTYVPPPRERCGGKKAACRQRAGRCRRRKTVVARHAERRPGDERSRPPRGRICVVQRGRPGSLRANASRLLRRGERGLQASHQDPR